ncbi:MAG: hypothetical protein GX174_14560 [Lentisphaerae bacterium]|jgi:hypothetical protein|nr:hypothetical protein [Lentisphaerota bacterium]
MKHFIVIVTAVLIVTSAISEQGVRVVLDTPTMLVQGFPLLLSITSLNDRAHSLDIMPKLDFATDLSGSQGAGLSVNFKGPAGTCQIGSDGYGSPESVGCGDKGTWSLNPWQRATLSFDLKQILLKSTYCTGSQLPAPGKYEVTASLYYGTWISTSSEVTVREPTSDEKRFLVAMHKQGVGEKWFPAIISDDSLQIPNDIVLPADTAQLRDFIKLLRLAVRNPDSAASQIESRKESWGYFQDILSELRYECVTASRGKESAKAQEIRQALDSGFKTKGGLTRIDKIGGLLDHFKEIQSAKQLGIRK